MARSKWRAKIWLSVSRSTLGPTGRRMLAASGGHLVSSVFRRGLHCVYSVYYKSTPGLPRMQTLFVYHRSVMDRSPLRHLATIFPNPARSTYGIPRTPSGPCVDVESWMIGGSTTYICVGVDHVPSLSTLTSRCERRRWSWRNQLLTALSGYHDARGYRQWQEVGRHGPAHAPMLRRSGRRAR